MTQRNSLQERRIPVALRARRLFGPWLIMHLLLAGCATEGKQQDANVEWSSNLDLGDAQPSNLEEWRHALSAPWTRNEEPVSFPVSNGTSRMIVDTCLNAFAAVEQDMQVQGPDQGILEGWTAKCYAVQVMLNGIDPKQSLLEGFTLTEKTVSELPVGLALVLSTDDARKVAEIKSTNGTLGDYLENVSIRTLEDGEAVTIKNKQTNDTQFLSVLARGDFDRDGFGDLLIYAANTLRGGARVNSTADLYMISRLIPNGPLVLRRKIM